MLQRLSHSRLPVPKRGDYFPKNRCKKGFSLESWRYLSPIKAGHGPQAIYAGPPIFVSRSFLYPHYDYRKTENLEPKSLLYSNRKRSALRVGNSQSSLEKKSVQLEFQVDLQIRYAR